MDAFTHTILAVGSLVAFYFVGQYFARKDDDIVAEEAVDFLLHLLEKDGFIKTIKDEDGERELIPISEIVTDAVRNVKT